MFSSNFYKKIPQVRLVRTALPTGVLVNACDLINHPRPWVTVEQVDEIKQEPKVLIFANHFFAFATYDFRRKVYMQLARASRHGFRILILSPQGHLVEWHREDISEDYTLDYSKFTSETISGLAWKQHHLAVSEFYVLDLFGCNELMGYTHDEIDFDEYLLLKNEKDIEQFLVSSRNKDLYIRMASKDAIELFLKLDIQKLKQRKNLILNLTLDKTTQHFAYIFKEFNIDYLSLDAIDIPEEFKPSLNNLTQLQLIDNAAAWHLFGLFRSAPNLKELFFYNCTFFDVKGEAPCVRKVVASELN